MKILIVEDETVSRERLHATVSRLGHNVVVAADGAEAWARIHEHAFDLVISDWTMPGVDGLELCARIRARAKSSFCYVILITARDRPEDFIQGVMAGADDFVTKPWHAGELAARLHAAQRIVDLERGLARRVSEVEDALHEVDTLRGLLPVCMYCHDVRPSDDIWQSILQYMMSHEIADLTHTICPTCYEVRVEPELAEFSERCRGQAADAKRERV
jgi:sigma-B regulation protein RsbU (phosphoserine phosphatase)